MRPRVKPDMIPANMTRKHEIPAYTNHHTDPNGIPSLPASWFRVSNRVTVNVLTTLIAMVLFFFFGFSSFFSIFFSFVGPLFLSVQSGFNSWTRGGIKDLYVLMSRFHFHTWTTAEDDVDVASILF